MTYPLFPQKIRHTNKVIPSNQGTKRSSYEIMVLVNHDFYISFDYLIVILSYRLHALNSVIHILVFIYFFVHPI